MKLDTTFNRSRITSGRDLLPGVDGRSMWYRRFQDVNRLHLSDLGGIDQASEAEKAIVRRTAALITELEMMEVAFASTGSTPTALDLYQRMTNTMRRNLESVGLKRRQVDVTHELEHFTIEGADRSSATDTENSE